MKVARIRGGVRLLVAVLLLALALPVIPAITARAAGTTYYVGTLVDDAGGTTGACAVATNFTCTLRDALAVAADGDAIQFDPNASFGMYLLGTGVGQGTLVVAHSVTITGPGPDKVAVDGGLNAATQSLGTRVFLVNPGITATITGLEITHGNADIGGGIANNGILKLGNDVIDHNDASADGGGVSTDGAQGALTIATSTITGNIATGFGGGIDVRGGAASISSSTIGMNHANTGGGGGILSQGTMLTLAQSTVTENTASNAGGGGIEVVSGTVTVTESTISGNSASGNGAGGGILSFGTMLTLTGGTISNNSTGYGGGGLYTNAASITGSAITGNSSARFGGGIHADAPITVTNATISNNTAVSTGGGIDTGSPLTVTNSTISGNMADTGGGILAGTLSLTNSTVSGNTVATQGGGLTATGALTIANSTISGNKATAIFSGGGGIDAQGSQATITNSTIARNAAGNSGAGLYNQSGTAALTHVTLSGNAGFSQLYSGSGPVTVTGSIIAGNAAPINCSTPYASLTDGGHNLQTNDTSCGGTITVIDPLLDPAGMRSNGGPTQTIALLPGSPAIDAVPVAGASCPATDQRGTARPQPTGGACDIGAYEYVPVQPAVTGAFTIGTAGQTVRITGTGFQSGSRVLVAGTPLPAGAVTNLAADGTALTVALPAHAAGAVTLAVANPGGLTSAATGNLTYTMPNSLPQAKPTAPVGTTPPASLPAPRANGSSPTGASGNSNPRPLPTLR
jgi:hypothetical protein